MAKARRKARGSRSGVRRGELTPAEIEKSAPQTPDSGFSLRTSGRGAGRPARNIFSVGYSPEQGRGAEVAVDRSQPVAEQLLEFNRKNAELLGYPGANMIQGGWHDPETGLIQQDTSVALPKTSGGFGAAMQIGAHSRQAAVGNVGPSAGNPYIGDINIPEHLHKGQFVWHETGGIEPRTTDLGMVQTALPDGTPVIRQRVKITPSRKEMVGVEAGILSERMNLPKD